MPCSAQATISPAAKMLASSGSGFSAKTSGSDASPKASARPSNSSFTYGVTVTCPSCKDGQTPLPRDPAVLTVQLPPGFRLVEGTAPKTVATRPVADANNLVTWRVPSPPSKLSLKLVIQSTDDVCLPQPDLVGRLCLGSGCQALQLSQRKNALGGY